MYGIKNVDESVYETPSSSESPNASKLTINVALQKLSEHKNLSKKRNFKSAGDQSFKKKMTKSSNKIFCGDVKTSKPNFFELHKGFQINVRIFLTLNIPKLIILQLTNLQRHKDVLKKNILKKRSILERNLQDEIVMEMAGKVATSEMQRDTKIIHDLELSVNNKK